MKRKGMGRVGGGCHSLITTYNQTRKNYTYMKVLFYGTTLSLLRLTLSRGSALHTPEKAKKEMISTRLDNSNKVHPCSPEKKGRGRGWREWAGGRRTEGGGAERGGVSQITYK